MSACSNDDSGDVLSPPSYGAVGSNTEDTPDEKGAGGGG